MYIGILGGSFNPIHIGHIRLAIEVLECKSLPRPLDRIDLVPCSIPPHKSNHNILPFDLRLAMLHAATKNLDGLYINPLEHERSGPSYTFDTLNIYKQKYPQSRLLFLVGGEDFAAISQWFRGLELPTLADIAMLTRHDHDVETFYTETKKLWPEAKINQHNTNPWAEFEHGSRLFYLPLLRLDISASYIRNCWCKNKNLHMLMPKAALEILKSSHEKVNRYWNNSEVKNECT